MCDCGGYSIGQDDQTIEKHQSEMSHRPSHCIKITGRLSKVCHFGIAVYVNT